MLKRPRALRHFAAPLFAICSAACGMPGTQPRQTTDATTPASADTSNTRAAPTVEADAQGLTPSSTTMKPSTTTSDWAAGASPTEVSLDLDTMVLAAVVPAEAQVDPLAGSMPDPPETVIAVERWFLPECCRFGLVAQIEPPLYPREAVRETFTVADLVWTVYEGGPMNGTEVAAVARIGSLSISVAAQANAEDEESVAATSRLVRQVASSVRTTSRTVDA